jgi:hypothetical protein
MQDKLYLVKKAVATAASERPVPHTQHSADTILVAKLSLITIACDNNVGLLT